jgi:hypothetical protein
MASAAVVAVFGVILLVTTGIVYGSLAGGAVGGLAGAFWSACNILVHGKGTAPSSSRGSGERTA